jgi:hypothetical protein
MDRYKYNTEYMGNNYLVRLSQLVVIIPVDWTLNNISFTFFKSTTTECEDATTFPPHGSRVCAYALAPVVFGCQEKVVNVWRE